MSLVTYNGITLPYAYHANFEEEAVGDESNTDWMLVKFDISVVCLVNSDYLAALAPTLLGAGNSPLTTNPATIMKALRQKLKTRRRALSVSFNGQNLLPDKAGVPGTVDAANGPIPVTVNYQQLTNTTFILVFRVIAQYWENNTVQGAVVTNNPGSTVLDNRWSESVSMDALGKSTRVREGKFFIRSDNNQGFIADQLRQQMAVVGVPTGFLRKQSYYKVDPSGLAIQYRIEDEEQFKMPPSPAFVADGEFTERIEAFGTRRWVDVRVTLAGDRATSQRGLLNTALTVATNKIADRAKNIDGGAMFVENAYTRHSLYRNEVEVSITMRMSPGVQRVQGIGSFNGIDVTTPLSDNLGQPYTPPYQFRGSASVLIQAAAYYDPSLTNNQLDQTTGQMNNGREVGFAGNNPEP